MNNDILFQVVDEIDHFTLKYRQTGEFDRNKANSFIRKYTSYYPEAAALGLKFRTDTELTGETIENLYNDLIALRTVLLENSFKN